MGRKPRWLSTKPINPLDGRHDLPAEVRFELQTNQRGARHPTLGWCWHWTGSLHPKTQRPVITVGGKLLFAYRWAYETYVGPIGEGLVLLHLCDNKLCVNPAHMRPGTQQENIADMDAKGRRGKRGPTTRVGKPRKLKGE
jgi:hypothetical protein